MRKTRVIALVLCAAFVLMGAGYAYWTDQLVISNSVVTGELNVKYTSASITSALQGDYFIPGAVSFSDKNASFAANNLYPGASVNYKATVSNNGTIPAVIGDIVLTNNYNEPIVGKEFISEAQKAFFLITGTITVRAQDGTIRAAHSIPSGKSLANISTLLENAKVQLEPSDYAEFDINMTVDAAVVDSDNLEHRYVKSDISIGFKQHNQ